MLLLKVRTLKSDTTPQKNFNFYKMYDFLVTFKTVCFNYVGKMNAMRYWFVL